MEEIFYDYQKKKYAVLDAVGENDWQLYLVKNEAEGRYFIIENSEEFMKSAKPLRSVFNKYATNVMYDIPRYCQEIPGDALKLYEEKKYDVLAYDIVKRQELEQVEKLEQAKQNGWRELNHNAATYAVSDKTLNMLVDGEQFTINSRSDELNFMDMTEQEIQNFINVWIKNYNGTAGDVEQAQSIAECTVSAARLVERWVKDGNATSEFLTKKLVENLDITDKYSGYKSDSAFVTAMKIVEHMSANNIPLKSDATLMGDCNELPLDIGNVIKQHQVYNENFRENAIVSDLEAKAVEFLNSKQVMPLNVAVSGEKKYTEIIPIPNPYNLNLNANKFFNHAIGTNSYDIVLKSDYPYFDVPSRIIGSCNQQTLNSIMGADNVLKNKLRFKPVNQADSAAQKANDSPTPNNQKQFQM